MRLREIRKGQQYYRVDGATTVWQVRAIFGDPSGIRHARLFKVGQPNELKTLTCSVLRDASRFRLLAEQPAAGSASSSLHSW
jgi:hypothetical protein